jgi:hypothetical protein
MTARFCIMPAKIVGDKRFTITDLHVLHALGLFADRDGWCWPSHAQLAEKASLARRTIVRSMIKLQKLGYVAVSPRSDGTGRKLSNKYRIIFDTAETLDVTDESHAYDSTRSHACDTQGVTSIKNTPIERPKEETPTPLPDWLNLEAWHGLLEMRKEKGKAAAGRAQTLLIRKLDRFRQAGHDPTAILEKSIISGWLDVFEPKPESRASPPHRPAEKRSNVQTL